MQEIIKLRNPVRIDGENVDELTADVEKITADQFIEAEILAGNAAAKRRMISAKIAELDSGFHFYLGVEAIIAENPSYSVQDIERIVGPDIRKIMQLGRNFMTADVEEDEDEDSASIEDEDAEDEEAESYLQPLE